MQPPQLPEGEFSELFRDFVDKCLQKDQAERWSVKQLLNHDFIRRHCAASSSSSLAPTEDEDDESDAKRPSSGDDSKEQIEMDEIVRKAIAYYMKDAKELIVDRGYSLDDIVGWIQLLPAMQKA